jgi:hypothetical protein
MIWWPANASDEINASRSNINHDCLHTGGNTVKCILAGVLSILKSESLALISKVYLPEWRFVKV